MVVKRVVVAHQFGLPSFHDWKHSIGAHCTSMVFSQSLFCSRTSNALLMLPTTSTFFRSNSQC